MKPRWTPLLLIPAVLSLFWPVLLHPSHILHPTFSPFSDTMIIHWPKAHLMAQSWQAGAGLPYWTPLILSGMPLAANQLAMLFYPPAWLFLGLPIEPVFNLLFIFHLLLGGFGLYFLLRRAHGLSRGAALLGGLTFALNGKWLAHAAGGHVSMVGAIGWLPWVVFGMQMLLLQGGRGAGAQGGRGAGGQGSRGAREQESKRAEAQRGVFSRIGTVFSGGRGWVLLAAVGLAMQIVTHTLLLLYTLYLVGAMVAWHFIFGIGANRKKEQSRHDQDGQVSGSSPAQNAANESQAGPAKASTPVRLAGLVNFLTPARLAEARRLLLPLMAIPILAGLLGAAQLLPLLELARFSNRALSLAEAADFAVSPAQLLIGLLLPSAQGGHEFVIYLGLVPLIAAPFGLNRQKRWSWFYGLLIIFAVLFALGPSTPLHSLFYHFAPGFRWVRTPARIFFVGALAVAALVGFGVDRLAHQRWSPRAKGWLARLAVGVGALALLTGMGLVFGFDQRNRAALGLAIFIPAALGLILLRVQRLISASTATVLLGITLFLDLASFDAGMMHFLSPVEALRPDHPPAGYLAETARYDGGVETAQTAQTGQKSNLFRVYSPSYSLPVQTAALANLHLADGVEPVHLALYDQYMARAGGYGQTGFSVTIPNFGPGPLDSALRETEPNLKLLGMLNVVYLVSAFPMDWPGLIFDREIDGTFVYRNEYALPRAWIASQTVAARTDWLAQLEKLPDLARVAVVDGKRPGIEAAGPARSETVDPVKVRRYSANRIELETELTAPGWLVLSEIWYPGWQATVNGAPRPVEKVNGLLRGLYLDRPGDYQITLLYRPRSVVWGGWISGVTVGVVVLGAVFIGLKRRNKIFIGGEEVEL